MGNLLSSASTGNTVSTLIKEPSESEIMENMSCFRDDNESIDEQFHDTVGDNEESFNKEDRNRGEEMNEFRRQLDIKREQRRVILDRHRSEKKKLENRLNDERKSQIELCENNKLLRELLIKNNINIPQDISCAREDSYVASSISEMKEEIEQLKSSNNTLRCDLAKSNNALQEAYSDIADLSAQNTESINQVKALKEVVTVSKTMINLREEQLNELKNKLNEIEQSLADRETSVLSTDLRKEYERQLQNIRTLRGLYEERARLAEVTRQALVRELDEHKILLQAETNKSKDLNVKVQELESKVNALEDTVEDKNNLIATCQEETRGIKAEMLAVNKLFSQVLLGYKNKQDLDKLIYRLEENHGILTHMAGKENSSEVSSELPKLLLEIVNQIDENEIKSTSENANGTDVPLPVNTSPEEIVQNLPKVWRVLKELLSHQSEADTNTCEKVTTCYKSVETKSGPVLVPSVSQTYIRLKDLILEKLALVKEVNRMKQLNTHLESRLGEQEKRLCLVTNELSKTWHVVGRLRRHHHQLHTHEKILKYELQQKRKLLNELKEALEYCREKWEQAREKNTQSEKDWRKLRTEFSNRKLKPDLQALNNSAESGYSDERPSDESSESNDENEYLEPKVKCKKKFKKSFETIVDSSADFNLVAEREDPASDMLDVADLPLDTQEDNLECDVSGSCNSENMSKERICEETEDEVNDSFLEETLIVCDEGADSSIISVKTMNNDDRFNTKNLDLSDPSTSVDNTKEISSLQETAQSSSICLDKSQYNDHTTGFLSTITDVEAKVKTELQENDNNLMSTTLVHLHGNDQCKLIKEENVHTNVPSTSDTEGLTDGNQIDFNAILENIQKQNDRLELKDKRLEDLEQGCSTVLENISKTLTVGDNIIAKLDTLHADSKKTPLQESLELCSEENHLKLYHSPDSDSDSKSSMNTETPSSSREVDHEARFAARDLRLKRLEEQTKSLVKKVNKTATKGVKIHYKLEELHNIYGSEHSRSGTPSEDTEDISQDDDENENE